MPRIVVLHRGYGCDTGCCGHVVELDGNEVGQFEFMHPENELPDTIQQYIRDLVIDAVGEEHVADIDFEHCVVVRC